MKTTFEIVMMVTPLKTHFPLLLLVRMTLLQPLSAEGAWQTFHVWKN